MDPKQFDVVMTNLINLEAHMPEMSPFATPARDPAQVLATYRANLLMARDCTALKLASLRSGTSAFKTTGGMLRGFQEALDLLDSEGGQA